MKTVTVTWIYYNNYGTELQAYSLQSFLKDKGIENKILWDKEIISAKRRSASVEQSVTNPPAMSKAEGKIKKLLRKVKRYLFNPKAVFQVLSDYIKARSKKRNIFDESQKLFENFKSSYLSIDYDCSVETLGEINDRYDVFITGSDQIWSPLDINFNGYFYLDFVTKKKVSYAPSLGTDEISPEKKAKIKQWLSTYSAISVREKSSTLVLSELTQRDVVHVCDPTLLHDKEFWTEFCQDVSLQTPRRYICCYFLSNRDWYFDYAYALAKFLGCRLVLIPTSVSFIKKKGYAKFPVGPKEFVKLIKEASFVLTDSYHASIFSVLFEKQFLYLKRFKDTDENCQNIRIYSLFEKLGLSHLIVSEKDFQKDDVQHLAYQEIKAKLMSFREDSRQFLLTALENE